MWMSSDKFTREHKVLRVIRKNEPGILTYIKVVTGVGHEKFWRLCFINTVCDIHRELFCPGNKVVSNIFW